MAWYAYCITEQAAFLNGARARRPVTIPNLRGVNDSAVLAYPSGEFAVIVSEHPPRGGLDQKAVIDHARVVSECFRNTTVLPFRFGTIFDNDEALRRAVRANRRAFTESVSKLKGKSEMHLKLVVHDGMALREAALPLTVGGEYLTKLRERAARERERQSKARSLSVQVHKLFHPQDEEVSCKRLETGGLLIDIAHLIDSNSIEVYQNRYNLAARQLAGCRIQLSGPWPPYHFTPGKIRTIAS